MKGGADLAQLLGLVSHKKLRRVNKAIKNKRAQIDSPGYKGNQNKSFSPIMRQVGRGKNVGFVTGYQQGRDPRDKVTKTTTKSSKAKAPSNPQMTAGYQPGSLMDIIRPVGAFSSGQAGDFGPRTHPAHGGYSYHTGQDMSESAGTNIYAAASGIVDDAEYDNIYGNKVVLYHGNSKRDENLKTMYGHMQTLMVKPGQKVAQGDIIGHVGTTGLSTGNHLHFETWVNDKPVNPVNFLREKDKQDLGKAVAPKPQKTHIEHKYERAIFGFGRHHNRTGNRPNPTKSDVTKVPRTVTPSDNKDLEAFLSAISDQESGDNYQAVGVPTKYGTAYGKYQILDSNIEGPGGWDKDALGKDINITEYLHDPQYQERIARNKLTTYYNKYGAGGAAKAWYGGEGVARSNSDSPQYGGPSINDYANSVLALMRKYR